MPPAADPQLETLLLEFLLAAARDPSLREPLRSYRHRLAVSLDAKLRSSGARPGLSGEELAAIFEVLVNGLTMDRGLDPEDDQPVLLTKALRKLLADESAPAADARD